MTAGVIAGAVLGGGLFLLVVALLPRRVSLARQLAAFDSRPVPAVRQARPAGDVGERVLAQARRGPGRVLCRAGLGISGPAQ